METKIRNANLSDLPSLLNFAKSVGRFISADEVRTWLQIDPEALFVAETAQNGKLIGSCCGTRLTPESGFMGLYVVLEEYRGKGIGFKLWKAAKEHLGDRNIGVRGDPVNFKKYAENEGFCHVEDYVIVYYDSIGDSLPKNIISSSDIEIETYFEGYLVDCNNKLSSNSSSNNICEFNNGPKNAENGSKTISAEMNIARLEKSSFIDDHYNSGILIGTECVGEFFPSSVTIKGIPNDLEDGLSNIANQIKPNIEKAKCLNECQEIQLKSTNLTLADNSKGEEILSKVLAFDKLLHKRDRSFLVRQTFSWSSCRSKVAMVGGKAVGYACLRNVVTEHWIISPFYADTDDVAEMLLLELLRGFDFSEAPKGIQIRFPDKNIACKRLVEKFGFREKTVRVLTGFTKRCANIDTSKVYSFHSTVFCSE